MLLMIDNYDSFTYNLVQYFQQVGQTVRIFTNDAIDVQGIEKLNPEYIVLSPGPNAPEDAGVSLAVVQHFYKRKPLLGVCLGHQCLAHAFGASIVRAPHIVHGKTSSILHHKQGLFHNIPNYFSATRYHSLVIDPPTLNQHFAIDAWADDAIMAISHRNYPLFGIQFHPESILTENGLQLLTNFIHYEHNQAP